MHGEPLMSPNKFLKLITAQAQNVFTYTYYLLSSSERLNRPFLMHGLDEIACARPAAGQSFLNAIECVHLIAKLG